MTSAIEGHILKITLSSEKRQQICISAFSSILAIDDLFGDFAYRNVLLFHTHFHYVPGIVISRKIKNLFMVSARFCEINFILKATPVYLLRT